MRVFEINSVCGVRSTGRIATDIYAALKSAGHECKIAYGRFSAARVDDGDAIRVGGRFTPYVDALKSRLFGNAGFYSRAATKKLIKKIDAFSPDIVHLHNLHGYYLDVKTLFQYLKRKKIKTVWTLHDCWAFTGHCAYFDRADCNKWERGCEKCPMKREYPESLFFDRSKKQYAQKKQLFTGLDSMTIVTPSHWLKGLTERSFLGEYPVEVIHNGIDLSGFKRVEKEEYTLSLPDKKLVLGVALPFSERKGYTDFLKLSEALGDEYCVVMVGLSDAQLKELPKKIIGIKRTDSVHELAELYSRAECFVNLTYEDNFPTTNIESLACGTPIITYDTGGSVEAVTPENGLIVGKGDIEGVKSAVLRISESDYDRQAISASAREQYDSKVMAEKYLDVYQNL